MAYTINKTNGAVLTTIADGTIDNTSDLTLVGKNYSGYGEILNENFVKLMENFASNSQPASPLSGQLWWDTTNGLLKVYTGSGFKIISGSTASASQPTGATLGDLWFDTVNSQLRVYNGTNWTLIGPSFTAGTGTSGAIVTSVLDNTGTNHPGIVFFYANETVVAILSKDSTFTPQTAIPGFSTIRPGFQLSTGVVGATFTGTATRADLLDNLDSTQFLRNDANGITTGTLTVRNNTGVYIGASDELRMFVSSSDGIIQNEAANGDIYIKVNQGTGGSTNALIIDGTTATVSLPSNPNANNNSTRVATTAYVDNQTTGFLKVQAETVGSRLKGSLLPNANATLDLGSPTFQYADVYAVNLNGTAIEALYADLAERFEADAVYEPGTVVELGGAKEITAVSEELSEVVFGVISTKPGFLLNGRAGTAETHPAVALNGRVPVRVIGKVNKGDRLVSAGNGLARAAKSNEITSFNVIGRSLDIKTTDTIGTVNAVVKVQ